MSDPSRAKSIPNYERIKQSLLEEIERGKFTPHLPFVTYQEVCQRFGVSRITAERAINALVQDGILIRKRGRGTFIANSPADGYEAYEQPAQRSSQTIGCIMTFIQGGHSLSIIQGIERICREEDCTFVLCDSSDSVETEALNLQRLRKSGIDGLIVYPVEGYENTTIFETLRGEGVPIVMLDRYYPTIPTDVIVPDNVSAGYQITSYLIEKGHKNIATAWSEIHSTSVIERLIGYRQALQERQLMIDTSIASLRPYYTLADGERRTLLQSWLSTPNAPTAIIAAHDLVLQRLTMDLLSLGVKVGDDIVLASMDSPDPAHLLAMAEAVVTLPSETMGEQAARLLLQRIEAQAKHLPIQPPQHLTLPVRLTVPQSVIVTLNAANHASA